MSAADHVIVWLSASGSVIALVAIGLGIWASRRRRRLPAPAARMLVGAVRYDFGTIVARHGTGTPWFLDEAAERPPRRDRLDDLIATENDKKFKAALEDMRQHWMTCWNNASSIDPQQREAQVEAARNGEKAAQRAIDRYSHLMRKYRHLR